jgi:predicted pyridoxine 5'-phosphate oxidase superfamily flavin-nucleotide-binding protein
METPLTPFHAGELAMQTATGVSREAARIGRAIANQIAPNAIEFIGRQQLAIVATVDRADRPWCSAAVGEPGAFRVVDPVTLSLDLREGIVGDALADRTAEHASVGLLFLEVASRRRYRVNGSVVDVTDDRTIVRVAEAYPNCPKYIQRRRMRLTRDRAPRHRLREGGALGTDERDLIASADTFFVASAGPDHNLDASHRGGRPGFVRVDGNQLSIPDYAGNSMFNTLGNLAVNPAAGLLFIDFDTGATLQLCGTAAIDLEASDPATGGTNRAWTLTTTSWQRSGLVADLHTEFLDASPHNP